LRSEPHAPGLVYPLRRLDLFDRRDTTFTAIAHEVDRLAFLQR
jgi:hypothetical protein